MKNAVGAFVRAALLGAGRVAEKHWHSQSRCDICVVAHLDIEVPREAESSIRAAVEMS